MASSLDAVIAPEYVLSPIFVSSFSVSVSLHATWLLDRLIRKLSNLSPFVAPSEAYDCAQPRLKTSVISRHLRASHSTSAKSSYAFSIDEQRVCMLGWRVAGDRETAGWTHTLNGGSISLQTTFGVSPGSAGELCRTMVAARDQCRGTSRFM